MDEQLTQGMVVLVRISDRQQTYARNPQPQHLLMQPGEKKFATRGIPVPILQLSGQKEGHPKLTLCSLSIAASQRPRHAHVLQSNLQQGTGWQAPPWLILYHSKLAQWQPEPPQPFLVTNKLIPIPNYFNKLFTNNYIRSNPSISSIPLIEHTTDATGPDHRRQSDLQGCFASCWGIFPHTSQLRCQVNLQVCKSIKTTTKH